MLNPHRGEMPSEVTLDDRGKHRDPILVALAAANDDLVRGEVDVLDPEPAAFEDPEPGSIEQAGHETRHALEPIEDGSDLFTAEDDWQTPGAFGAHDLIEPGQRDSEHVPVEEQDGAQGLILRGGGHL